LEELLVEMVHKAIDVLQWVRKQHTKAKAILQYLLEVMLKLAVVRAHEPLLLAEVQQVVAKDKTA
jgi:hypothetical protein